MWSKDIRKERKLNIYNALIKSSLLYGSKTWRLTEDNKRRVEAMPFGAGLYGESYKNCKSLLGTVYTRLRSNDTISKIHSIFKVRLTSQQYFP